MASTHGEPASGEWLEGERVALRLVELADCGERYARWLADPEVNRFLETRFAEQDIPAIRGFVSAVRGSAHSHLFAICDARSREHVGNVKIGPVNVHHRFADVSYFVGERSAWGKGYGTEAVRLVTRFGFERLGLHRCQAGLYESNVASRRVLEKAGYEYDGRIRQQLFLDGRWEDHLWFGALRDTWA